MRVGLIVAASPITLSWLYYFQETLKNSQILGKRKHLPEEIITQILYRVPAKSIGRFRSVSKGWLSLLTHPDFIKSHQIHKHHLIFVTIKKNINCPAGLYSNPYYEPILRISDFGFDSRFDFFPYFIICDSCNGLVSVTTNDNSHFIHMLLNPTTKESMILPEYSDDSYMYDYECFNSDFIYGFGYDSESGDFKFVFFDCLYDPITNGRIFVHVYSLRTNNWRRLTDYLDDYRCIDRKEESVFVNGFLHLIAAKTVNGLQRTVILAFSLADEKFSEVPLPDFVECAKFLSSRYCRIVVLGGKLAFFHEMKGEIWLMNEYRIKESWTKILLHGIHGIPRFKPEYFSDKPMVFCHDGKFMVANNDRMMVYDDEKGTFVETVCVWDPDNFKVTGSYVESLVSISSCIEQ